MSSAELLNFVFFIFNRIMYLPVLSVLAVRNILRAKRYDNRKMTGYNRQSARFERAASFFAGGAAQRGNRPYTAMCLSVKFISRQAFDLHFTRFTEYGNTGDYWRVATAEILERGTFPYIKAVEAYGEGR